jgi:BTG family
MKVEVNSAADFVMQLLRVRQQVNSLSESQLHSFRGSLIVVLMDKYNNHWYETNPRKGKPDAIVSSAA